MNAKLQYRPPLIERNPTTEKVPADQADTVFSCIRQIELDAEQIGRDAADIEDARFLAANIVNACQRILSHQAETPSDSHDGEYSSNPTRLSAVSAAPEKSSGCREATARGRLTSLSSRELEIFTFLAEGHSAIEIAAKLSRSSKTINNHRTRILHKLGLRNATELVRLAVHSGLVSV